jgi:phosphopantothenoylcysteine decarboxylase / phosphopantothenate---cysteine ligase
MELKGKNILLGITGSIAAYKAATLVRLLVKEGASVKVIMTPLAKEFITPLTLATLSKNPILVDFFNPENGDWNSHVDLGIWADLYIIAPASANTMAKMATGVADNLLLTSYLSAKCPVIVAPAMDLDMYQHPTTQKNIQILKSFGNIVVEAATGELASGLTGKGRMEEPENILSEVKLFFSHQGQLHGKTILITSGPTYEPIDPVRFIGNHSSGKMGNEIASELAARGANVIFISGPVKNLPNHPNVSVHNVVTANQMYSLAFEKFATCNAAILAAAVADFTPKHTSSEKIKRKGDELNIELEPTQDIASQLGKVKNRQQVLVGFALETENEIENATRKIQSKNLDFIVLNSTRDEGAGFNVDTNKITIINSSGIVTPFPLKSKREVAKDIVNEMAKTMGIK